MHFGLIGKPLTHSHSEKFFTEKFATLQLHADYRNIELHDLDALRETATHFQLAGFNVTIPYKQAILPFIDVLDPLAASVQAVNCVVIHGSTWYGYNTDVEGFRSALLAFIADQRPAALVFGNGGASQAVQVVLNELAMPFRVVSRHPGSEQLSYAAVTESWLETYDLLINTTPVGMYPLVDDYLPIPYAMLGPRHMAYDLIYNPTKTNFLQRCTQQGCRTENGYTMWLEQAEASWRYFKEAHFLSLS